MKEIEKKISIIKSKIKSASLKSKRNEKEVMLLAVSKKKTAHEIYEAYNLGINNFGESFCQEAIEKINNLNKLNIKWHFIGKIQSNKAKDIAEYFDWVHTIDRSKIANKLSLYRPKNKKPLNVCIQINQGQEIHKGGLNQLDALDLINTIHNLPNLKLRGLMTIPPKIGSSKKYFSELRMLKKSIIRNGVSLDTLSMGMSSDFEEAIIEGSTIIRIGSSIFGKR